MNLITGYNAVTKQATIYDLDDDGLPVVDLPVEGMTMEEAIDFAEAVAADLLMEQDRQDDPHFASQGMNWRPE